MHRVGSLAIGDLAVWVGVSAGHRDAAFAACRYIIDEVKQRVPIWKNEHYVDGESGWLHPDNTPVEAPASGEALQHVEGGSPASYIPAPESFTTVAAFRPWRDLQTIVAGEPTGPP